MQSEIKVKYGMSIFDVLLATYGSSDYLVKLIKENNINADYNYTNNPGKVLSYDPNYAVPLPSDLLSKPVVVPLKLQTKGVNGQTIFDIMLMTYGTVDNLVKLVQQNALDNLNDESIDQKTFTFDTELIKDKIYFNSLGTYIVNTGGDINRAGAAATHFRITSSGEYRITSAGNKRIWE